MSDQKYVKGGSYILGPSDPKQVFTPEDFSEEHVMIQDTARKFVDGEVTPVRDEIDKINYDISQDLMAKAGELGLLGIEVEEDFGGIDLDKVTSTIVSEELGRAGSFCVTMGAHSGIATLPIVYYGTKEQKEKYLPLLSSGEWVGAYALTEPGSGSDALAAKTKAVLSDDKKHYVINGSKIFITNGGFAKCFIVFAKIDGEQFSAFIVERSFEGLSVGEEEKKLGIKGSSTTVVNLDNVKVPVENLLGEPGIGAKIALNILNIGRFKLGAGALGAAKDVVDKAVKYTSEREQFGKTINKFGMIQEKLAKMATRTFAAESMVYRTVGLIQSLVDTIDKSAEDAKRQILKSIEEYSIECSIVKVYGSEMIDFVSDEGLQCFGGYGFSQEYPMERAYRDSRINRIFEGTNEINRMLIPGMLLKKGLKGELDVLAAVNAVQKEITEFPSLAEETGEILEQEKRLLMNAKKAVVLASGAGVQRFGAKLQKEQELLGMVADCMIEVYALESVILRTLKLVEAKGEEKAARYIDIAKLCAMEAAFTIDAKLKEAAASVLEGDELKIILSAFKRFMKFVPINAKTLRRNLAAHLIEQGRYNL
ncbi:MAG: acyl-CoA dehydrogenase family protein [Fibrobacteria bacterium]|nr:acyl-CoA dehydrogenase family protein [Fibrobacteria bacterium]